MMRRLLGALAIVTAVVLSGGAAMAGALLTHGLEEDHSVPEAEAPPAPEKALARLMVRVASAASEAPPSAALGALVAEAAVLHAAPPLEALATLSALVPDGAPAGHALLDDCRYEDERTAVLELGPAEALAVSAGSGTLRVEGRAGLREVRAVGRLCASEREYLEDMDVRLERRGSTLEVRAVYPAGSDRRGRNDDYARIDLVIEAPEGVAADIEDGSGSLELRALGTVRLQDGSGSIKVDDARGDVRIDDGSGSIEVVGVAGDLEIQDGSGSIDARRVRGRVDVRDGSGSVTLREVDGSVEVADGSGSIDVAGVGGDFIVRSDGSGGIRHSDVSGRVDLPRDARERRGRVQA